MTRILPTPTDWPAILLPRPLPGDPTDLDAAVRARAFEGLRRSVRDLGSTATIATVARARLRGRGGAGYPAADKWRTAAETRAERRYVVANGYGADPAASGDRELLERNPYAVIEGAAIAALAVGADEAIIAVRADQSATIGVLETAVAAAEDAAFIGQNLLASGRDLHVTVQAVQGAYLLGEETILLKALENRRGQPEQRPPYPATRGLGGHPTVVQNVQTLAAVPWIMVNGAEAFSKIGSPQSPGTILVGLRGPAGDGFAEVPLGTPLREILALAGPLDRGRPVKAVLVGGPSGGFLPAELLDTPYEFDALRDAGAHVGSGSIVVADDRACVVDLARLLTGYCASQACGKTIPCRIGTRRLAEIAERMVSGRSRPDDPGLLADLSADVVASALCDHERLATLPLTTGMRYFRAELEDHVLRSTCPAGVCHPISVAAGPAH
jgi:NADH:ubiquinone oxidoreductase subunit F (NADH-binding)